MSVPRDERKERVIHARVPEALDEEIRRNATSLGLSVSNLVRNVLQNSFGPVEDIVADGAEVARSAKRRGARGRRRRPADAGAHPRVLGWQVARLSVNAVCEVCNELLARGTEAAIAVVEGGGSARFRCERCIDAVGPEEGSHDER